MTAATTHIHAVPTLPEARATVADAAHHAPHDLLTACVVVEDQTDDPAEAEQARALRAVLEASAPARPANTLARRAAILCKDLQFRTFVARRCGFSSGEFSAVAAGEFVRAICGISSRRDLDTTPEAAASFEKLRTDFDAWRGRIAAPS